MGGCDGSNEDIGDNTFQVHQPKWRSEQVNELLKELDSTHGWHTT